MKSTISLKFLKIKPESYFSLRELRRSMYMSYGRYDICTVRCDAQFNGAPCCYKKISQGRVEGHYGETPAIRHIHVKSACYAGVIHFYTETPSHKTYTFKKNHDGDVTAWLVVSLAARCRVYTPDVESIHQM